MNQLVVATLLAITTTPIFASTAATTTTTTTTTTTPSTTTSTATTATTTAVATTATTTTTTSTTMLTPSTTTVTTTTATTTAASTATTPTMTATTAGTPTTTAMPASAAITLNGVLESPIHPSFQPTVPTLPGLRSSDKAVSLLNMQGSDVSLTGWTLQILRDSGFTVSIPLDGYTIPASGCLIVYCNVGASFTAEIANFASNRSDVALLATGSMEYVSGDDKLILTRNGAFVDSVGDNSCYWGKNVVSYRKAYTGAHTPCNGDDHNGGGPDWQRVTVAASNQHDDWSMLNWNNVFQWLTRGSALDITTTPIFASTVAATTTTMTTTTTPSTTTRTATAATTTAVATTATTTTTTIPIPSTTTATSTTAAATAATTATTPTMATTTAGTPTTTAMPASAAITLNGVLESSIPPGFHATVPTLPGLRSSDKAVSLLNMQGSDVSLTGWTLQILQDSGSIVGIPLDGYTIPASGCLIIFSDANEKFVTEIANFASSRSDVELFGTNEIRYMTGNDKLILIHGAMTIDAVGVNTCYWGQNLVSYRKAYTGALTTCNGNDHNGGGPDWQVVTANGQHDDWSMLTWNNVFHWLTRGSALDIDGGRRLARSDATSSVGGAIVNQVTDIVLV